MSLNTRASRAMWMCMNYMGLVDVLVLKATSQRSDHLVSSYLNFKFRQLLVRYVTDTSGFRQLMRDMDAVISGSCATMFMLPLCAWWEGAELDLYVPYSQFDRVVGYLASVAHFTLESGTSLHLEEIKGAAQLARMSRNGAFIHVIRSKTNTALHPLPYSWTTMLMNFLSADSFCSAYPDLTTGLCGVINTSHMSLIGVAHPRTKILQAKYTARGFDLRSQAPGWSTHTGDVTVAASAGNCGYATRMFGDEYCLRVSLDPFAIGFRDVIDRQQITVVWRQAGVSGGEGCRFSSGFAVVGVEDVSTE